MKNKWGTGSTTASTQPVKVTDGVKQVSCGLQTTAIVKQDGTLWMCGRNDLGQIDDTRTVHNTYIKIADGVSQAILHWGCIDIEKSDGTTETRTWDENADSQRQPSPVSIDDVADMSYGWQNAIALKNDGSVWWWDADNPLSEAIAGRNPQQLEGISLLNNELTLEKNAKTVIAHRPMPLLADYEQLKWHSNNEAIATVSDRGVVSTHSDGMATITVTINDAWGRDYHAECKVVVGEAQAISDAARDAWQLRVAARNHQLVVSGVPQGQAITVYTASGACIWQGTMRGNQTLIPIDQSGIYIVRATRQVRKVTIAF